MFPHGVSPADVDRVQRAIGGRPPSVAVMRDALGAVDQQTTPTPMAIRWSADDLDSVRVGHIDLAVDRADASVSIQVVDQHSYEPHVAAAIERVLTPGATFVDVGANIGYHTVAAAQIVGPGGRVFAIEANPENARLLNHTVLTNALTNVTVLPFAASDHLGGATFGSHIGSNGGLLDDTVATVESGRGSVVPTMPLDALELDRVALMKLDVEGGEALVVDGAAGVIGRSRPVLIMEFSVEMTTRVSRRDPSEHLSRFETWGYDLAILDRSTGTPQPVDSVATLIAQWGSLARIEDLVLTPR
jgi:FkbM family methyltransferase